MITEETIVKAADNLSTAELDGEAVVLDINSGHYYGLNKVGARILDVLQEPKPVRDVIDEVLEQFDVEREVLKGDVVSFLEEMEEKKLVEVEL